MSAVPLAPRGAARSARESSPEHSQLARAAPEPAELQRAARAALQEAAPASCAVLLGVQPTLGLLAAIVTATKAAFTSLLPLAEQAAAPLQAQPAMASRRPYCEQVRSVDAARLRLSSSLPPLLQT